MKKINSYLVSAILGIGAITIFVWMTVSEKQEVKLTVLGPVERIAQDDPLRGDTKAIIKAARNEVESFQVVIGALKKNITVVNAEMSDLKGKTGIIGKENITLFREEYVVVKRSSFRPQLPPGLYADPLVPFINQVTKKPVEPYRRFRKKWGEANTITGNALFPLPFIVWRGQNQPVWVDVRVPKNTAAGEYSGTFTVSLKNVTRTFGPVNDSIKNLTVSIPVSLTVWDFTLPDGPTHRNHFGGLGAVATTFGVDPKSDRFREIEMNYCKMMSEHRINPPIPENLLPEMNTSGSLKITAERHKALKKFIDDLHVTDFDIPRPPLGNITTVDRDKAITYYREYYKYLKDNEWDKRSYLYMHDEPNLKENYEYVIALGEVAHTAAPQIKCLVTEQPYKEDKEWPDLDPAIDIWCPLFGFIDRNSINEKLAHGDEVWSYTALNQRVPEYHPNYDVVRKYDSPYWHIDALLTSYRTPTWMNYQYKINGLLYWSVVGSSASLGVSEPWLLPTFSNSEASYTGGGHLVYPGIPCGIEGPVSSIRLKVIRDSMEDYEYLVLLEQLAGRENVLKIVNKVAPEWWATTEDPNVIRSAREKIATEIMKLQKKITD
jgi:hypothetical protein